MDMFIILACILILVGAYILASHIFRNGKEKKAEIEYQLIIDTQISENEEFKKIFKENEKWDRIAELG